jgi:DNA-binding transcriptional MerR regulator
VLKLIRRFEQLGHNLKAIGEFLAEAQIKVEKDIIDSAKYREFLIRVTCDRSRQLDNARERRKAA